MNARYETRLATVPFIGARAADERKESVAKNIALFFAAPFVGLAYIVLFPFVAAGMLVWIGGRALLKKGEAPAYELHTSALAA